MTRETFRYLPDQVIDNWYREMEYAGEWFHEHQRCVFPVKDGCLGDYTAENFIMVDAVLRSLISDKKAKSPAM